MREIYVNGIYFRYKNARDLAFLLRYAKEPARLAFLAQVCTDVARRRQMIFRIIGIRTATTVA